MPRYALASIIVVLTVAAVAAFAQTSSGGWYVYGQNRNGYLFSMGPFPTSTACTQAMWALKSHNASIGVVSPGRIIVEVVHQSQLECTFLK